MNYARNIDRMRGAALGAMLLAAAGSAWAAAPGVHDVVIHNALIYDGSGGKPYSGEIAIDGDRIAYVGPHRALKGAREIDAHGQAAAPGFIDMMGHSEESLAGRWTCRQRPQARRHARHLHRAIHGPADPEMARDGPSVRATSKYEVTWKTLGAIPGSFAATRNRSQCGELRRRRRGAGQCAGRSRRAPTPGQLAAMRGLVRQAMEEGAMGVTTALIYAPMNYAKTPELIAMANESARCGGIYTAHMRSEGDHIEEAVQETIDIARASGAPAEIHHLKLMGRDNWGKLDTVVGMINAARASGCASPRTCTSIPPGGTALDASMPPWVHDGGQEAMVARLKDPAVRAKVIAAMREDHPKDWENLFRSGRRRRHVDLGRQARGAEAAHRQNHRRNGEEARRQRRGCHHRSGDRG